MVNLGAFERYLIEEFYDDYRDGLINKGTFTRRVAFIQGSMAAAAVAMTAVGKTIRPHVLTEGMLFLGDIGVADYATPTTQELGDNVGKVVVDHDCVILPYHGVIVAGTDLWTALAKLEVLEQTAQINCLVNQMGGEKPMPRRNIEGMLALREKMGMNLPSDANLLSD